MGRKRQTKKGETVQKLGKKVKNITRKLKKEPLLSVQSEVSGTLVRGTTPPTIVHVNPGITATNGITLEGMTAIIKGFRIKGWFASVGANNTGGRLDVILDRRPTPGTIATYDDVYFPASASGDTINSMTNGANKSRFKILMSIRATSVTNDQQRYYFDRYIKLNHVINTTTEANYGQATQNRNAILIAKWGDTAANLMTYAYITSCTLVDDN